MSKPSIDVSACVERCNTERIHNNKLVNGITVNGLVSTSICWCHINAGSTRDYRSCYMDIKNSGL